MRTLIGRRAAEAPLALAAGLVAFENVLEPRRARSGALHVRPLLLKTGPMRRVLPLPRGPLEIGFSAAYEVTDGLLACGLWDDLGPDNRQHGCAVDGRARAGSGPRAVADGQRPS